MIMVVLDGRTLAKKIERRLIDSFVARSASLHLILVGDDLASRQFVEIKRRFGQRVGVTVIVHEYQSSINPLELEDELRRLATEPKVHGLVVQLPLPRQCDIESLLALIPPNKDVDALGPEALVPAPVAGAVAEILKFGQVDPVGKKALVIGRGRLVGQPVSHWLASMGAQVKTADEKTEAMIELMKEAEIIVTGAGRPHFIKPEMIETGVVLIDAGTSDQAAGKTSQLVGDADPVCAPKCSLFTPVPGGVGPITVAKLFDNFHKLLGG